jgi:hypothetical protein
MPSRNKKIALGGVLGAMCILSLYFAVYLPVNRIFFYGLSSVFCGIMLTEAGPGWAFGFYFATSVLSFFIVPNKLGIVPYILFFGLYGIIKYFIELIRNIPAEVIIKGVLFLLAMTATAATARGLFAGEVYSRLPIPVLAVLSLIVFYIYDYVYSLFIVYYKKRLRSHIG